jgi:hypothetical protein
MKLKIFISSVVNFYYFVDNLADYHPFSRIWAFETIKNKLSLSQQKNLRKYKKIRKKYEGKKWYDDFFVSEDMKTPFLLLSKKLSSEELNIVKQTFRDFQKLFKQNWKNNKHILVKSKEYLSKYWISIEKGIFTELEEIMDIRIPNEIRVFLCFNPKASGGSLFGNKGVMLEIPPNYNIKELVCILIHEIVHYLDLQNKDSIKQIRKAGIPKNKAKIIHEAIIELFAPNGYLTKKYVKYEFKQNKTKWSTDVDNVKKIIQPIFKDYLRNINKNYWNDFIPQIIEKF